MHVGTKIGSKIDANFERPILKKVLNNQRCFIDFSSFWGRSWHQKSIKNGTKIEVQDGLPLGIDFWWILVSSGRQVGVENRAKSEQKSIKKTHRKNYGKKMLFGGPWGAGTMRAQRARVDPGTP